MRISDPSKKPSLVDAQKPSFSGFSRLFSAQNLIKGCVPLWFCCCASLMVPFAILAFWPAEPEVVIAKSGYLTKQGGARGGRKNWKKRFFVLKEDCLFYYSEENNLLGVMPVHQSRLYDFSGESRPPPKFISRPFCCECKNKFSFGTRSHHCRFHC